MCHKLTAYGQKLYVWTKIFEPSFNKFAWQFKTETSAAVFHKRKVVGEVVVKFVEIRRGQPMFLQQHNVWSA